MSELAESISDRKLDRAIVALRLLASFDTAATSVAELTKRAAQNGRGDVGRWNISSILVRQNTLCVRTTAGWTITQKGRAYLKALDTGGSPIVQVKNSLRIEASKINHPDVKAFVIEAIDALEHHLLRSAVVLSWVGASAVLQGEIFRNNLAAFNVELVRRDAKAKAIKALDDFGSLREYDFLQIAAAISVFGKSVKQALETALSFRNGCGHPNALKIGENMVAAHIESLILNVFAVY